MARSSERRTRSSFAQIAAIALVMLACISGFAGSAEAAIGWRGNFETGSFSQWDLGVQALQGPAEVVSTRARDGRYSARFEVRPNPDPDARGGERSEILTQTGEQAGAESWWAWSTYFGEDFRPTEGTHWNIFTDWHNTAPSGQANVHFEVNTLTSPWTIQMRTFGGQQDQNQQIFVLSDFKRNAWVDFVFHVRWAPDNTGFVEAWVDGRHVLPRTNTPTIYEGQGVYLKQGLYRDRSSVTSVVYHDAMRRGTSFADVATPGAGVVGDSATGTRNGQEVGSATVMIVRRPTIAPGRRIHVQARTKPGATVRVIVRGPRGSVLGSNRLRAGVLGRLDTSVYLPRWLRQRTLVVVVRAVLPDGARRAIRTVRVSQRELRLARTG
jgi:polysaccharide lyase-like protein